MITPAPAVTPSEAASNECPDLPAADRTQPRSDGADRLPLVAAARANMKISRARPLRILDDDDLDESDQGPGGKRDGDGTPRR